MLTLFTMPKPFRGHIGMIQRNAVRSWTLLNPEFQVILIGEEEGTRETAAELGIDHVPEVPRNEFGTPLVNGIFAAAENRARNPLLCYLNADILLLPDFAAAVRRVARSGRPFLMMGQRWDLDVTAPLEFSPGWPDRMRQLVRAQGTRHGPEGIDYFVHPRGAMGAIPAFAIGRPCWDNWMLAQALARGLRLIDATDAVCVVHQNHDYAHLAGGQASIHTNPEAARNRELAGNRTRWHIALDAPWILTPYGVMPALTRRHLNHRYGHLLAVRTQLRRLLRYCRDRLFQTSGAPR